MRQKRSTSPRRKQVLRQGQVQGSAASCIETRFAEDAKYGEAYYRSALTELQMGPQHTLEVVRDLHRAVELQPDNLDAYERLINIYINAYLMDKKHPVAIVTELKGLADKLAKNKHSNTYEYYRLNGYVALMENKGKDAIGYFEKANAIKPLQPDLALVYLQALSGDGRQAERKASASTC